MYWTQDPSTSFIDNSTSSGAISNIINVSNVEVFNQNLQSLCLYSQWINEIEVGPQVLPE